MKRPHAQRKPRGTAVAAVAMCLVFFTIAGVVHHHGLPGRSHPSPALAGDPDPHGSLTAPCLACRSSHEQISAPVAPPSVEPVTADCAPAVPHEAPPCMAPGRDAGASRAPPSGSRGTI